MVLGYKDAGKKEWTIICIKLFGEGPFLFWLDNTPMYLARFAQKCFVKFGEGKHDWPPQTPDLNSLKHIDKTCQFKHHQQTRFNHPTSVPNLML